MQIPRGKFRSIKKGISLGEILDGMATSGFSGICSFSSATIKGTMVFKGGVIILAKVQDQYGDPAVVEARLVVGQVIDAVLSDLDGTQVQLALEFNKHAHVQKAGNWQEVFPQKDKLPVVQDTRKKHVPGQMADPIKSDFIKPMPVTSAGSAFPAGPDKNWTTDNSLDTQKPPVQEPAPQQDTPLSSAEKEFETFDSMDLEDVTQKIRRDSKILLKQLELDHLMEK